MDVSWILLFFSLGTILGSFFNVVGLRLPQKISFSNDRSYCLTCQEQLRWFELIPIISYLIQRGRCRTCHERILPLYPMIELTTGLLFMLSFWNIGFNFELIIAFLLISMLMIVVVTDVTYLLIPNQIILFFLPLMVVMRMIFPLDPWYDAFIGAGIGFGLIAIIIILSKGGMGGGDMKLFGVLGFALGWKGILLTLFLASCIGAVIGMVLIGLKQIERKQPIPFVPFIAVAALISYFYGESLITIYLVLF